MVSQNLPARWNYGAVERALRDAANRGDRCIFEPTVGKLFDSPEEAFEFFNMYSWEKGFGIRFNRLRKNGSGRKTRHDIVCACEGMDAARGLRSARTGCRAMITLLRGDDDGWFVSRFVDEHTHPLAATCGERRQWQSHSRIDQATRDIVRSLRENNVQISRVCSIIGGIHGATTHAPFSRQSIRTLCAKIAQESIEGDIEKTLALFTKIRMVDPCFTVELEMDSERRIKSMLWCHGSSIDSYKVFGDAVTFDTTYRTNLYNLPFGLFVGVNNHFQSTIFGGVMLTEETTESFVWAFEKFIEALGGSKPKTILTDQCLAMKSAIQRCMPTTRHRWCKWHVLKKAKESLGGIYSKNSTSKKEFHELLDEFMLEKGI
ncbi:hypothetical protein HU200_066131 [Digitaria exilis]|uniref:Protein FAR1-RELATED SEQUENCE n=1 Tax=Digitaria exilis TaxID=1010633 RepID=A0A834ZYS3_9POAL|nr:hypothetical protein HU200_066131 [Digitaria exilis]